MREIGYILKLDYRNNFLDLKLVNFLKKIKILN